MASVAEMRAQAGAIKARLEEANAAIRAAIDTIAQEKRTTAAMLDESGHDAAAAAMARMHSAETACDDAIANNLAAMEQLDTYIAGL